MAVIVMASVAGAPVVTTSAVALTFAWHRPMLLVGVPSGLVKPRVSQSP